MVRSADSSGAPGLAVAFPGQGVKQTALRAELDEHRDDPLVSRLACLFSTTDWAAVDFSDTRLSQPATFVASLLSAQRRFGDDLPQLVLGHSLGEITALVFVGSISVDEGFELVRRRGEVCNRAQAERAGNMIAVMGLDETELEWVRRVAVGRTGMVLEVAARNGARQTVLSGDGEAVAEAARVAGKAGGICQLLAIGGAFHSPLMLEASVEFERAVSQTSICEPKVPLLSAIDCQLHSESAGLGALLVSALVLPVRWLDALGQARAHGITTAWDTGPGRTLSRLGTRGGPLAFTDG